MMDLHAHSIFSDGSETPEQIVRLAKQAGLSVIALTDHDSMDGVEAAKAQGQVIGVKVVPAIEIDIEYTHELHMLAYGLNIHDKPLLERLAQIDRARDERNQKIVARLKDLGVFIELGLTSGGCIPNRTHIANALAEAGYVKNNREAFVKYLGPTGSARYDHKRMSMEEAMSMIQEAGGLPVMAHPGQYKGNLTAVVALLKEQGLWGIEVYYPAHTEGQIVEYRSLASRYSLYETCGSDYHGAFRAHVPIGAVSLRAAKDPKIASTEKVMRERI